MPHLLIHRSTITLPCLTAHSTQSFCRLDSVGLRRPPPDWIITTTTCGGSINGVNRTIICMANPRRVKMVAKQIRRELSDMLLTDKVLQYAVLPEALLWVPIDTCHRLLQLVMLKFLLICRAEVKAKYVRGELGKRVKLRLTPEVRFLEDESLERGSRYSFDGTVSSLILLFTGKKVFMAVPVAVA
ncbi:hypothetical protein DH2020_029630 [Rehmannia glutinosa]|uniref:Uncharacterized protein n=1 Tax=Rehmannia glutinosa TaxID=99300 RepID=A0ABR0VRP2_REHGL